MHEVVAVGSPAVQRPPWRIFRTSTTVVLTGVQGTRNLGGTSARSAVTGAEDLRFRPEYLSFRKEGSSYG